jgi:hypothetical protein
MKRLPISSVPAELSYSVREIGKQWAFSELRPRLPFETKQHWDSLIHAWLVSDLPLVIRKSGGARGEMIVHQSGRKIILADNSPAQWAFSRAYAGELYALDDIRRLLENDKIPFAFATKSAEKARMTFRCTLSVADCVNTCDWKLCHIQEVGLKTRISVTDLPIEILERHFSLFLNPVNLFLVPLKWSGFGEIPEVIEEIGKFESANNR